jgi:hypothetical protein
MFDSSKGYTIDTSRMGVVKVSEGLDNILKVVGTRISRNNPLLFEVDLGFAVDLGVVSIERATIRLNMSDPTALPELTAFAASIDIPGVLNGRGYLKLDSGGGFSGQIDLTLVPIQLRVAAGIQIKSIDTNTGHPVHATGIIVHISIL